MVIFQMNSMNTLTSLQQKIDLSTIFPPKETNKKLKFKKI